MDNGPKPKTPLPFWGILLILTGALLLAGSFIPGLSIGKLWPAFLLVPAILMFGTFLQDPRGNSGVMFPIGVLVFLALHFFWFNLAGWEITSKVWPNFILTPVAGFVLLFIVKPDKGLFVPIFVLTAIALVCYSFILHSQAILASVFILAGVLLLISSFFHFRIRGDKKE